MTKDERLKLKQKVEMLDQCLKNKLNEYRVLQSDTLYYDPKNFPKLVELNREIKFLVYEIYNNAKELFDNQDYEERKEMYQWYNKWNFIVYDILCEEIRVFTKQYNHNALFSTDDFTNGLFKLQQERDDLCKRFSGIATQVACEMINNKDWDEDDDDDEICICDCDCKHCRRYDEDDDWDDLDD